MWVLVRVLQRNRINRRYEREYIYIFSRFSHVWLCNSMDYGRPGSSVHGNSLGKNIGVGFIYIYIIGISSHNYVGQEDPQSVVCKLKIRKATGVIHSYSEGLRTRAANVVYSSPRPKVQELRSWCEVWVLVQRLKKMDVSNQVKSKFTLPPLFCSIQPLSRLDDAHPHRWVYHSNTNLFQKHPHRHFQK